MSRRLLMSAVTAAMIGVCLPPTAFAQVTVVVNNIGYERTGAKRAVVQSSSAITATSAQLVNAGGTAVHTVTLGSQQTVAQWSNTSADWPGFRYFKVADFSDFNTDGDGYRVRVGTSASPAFSIGEKVLQRKTGADQVAFFKAMRNTDAGDAELPVFGSSRTHNIYGGWWDATGDPGKHLSHLAYSNYFTPQQIPMAAWALLHAIEAQPAAFGAAAKDEAAWGADYLLRALSPDGYFYMSVFDNWSNGYRDTPADAQPGTRGEREICAWGTLKGLEFNAHDGTYNSPGTRTADYQSAMREGAGVSIAALARAYKAGISGQSTPAQYLDGAKRAYAHLLANPKKYQDDGTLNIIDFYCGLLAATELYLATESPEYLASARGWVDSLLSLQTPDGWFRSGNDSKGRNRPFYHAAEEGFPIVALTRFYQTAATNPEKLALREVVGRNLRWYHKITYDGANPFEYAKMWRAKSDPLSGGGPGGGGSGDLARGKTATASREEAGYPAGSAFDGSSTTRWSSYQSGAENDGQWIAVDLGGSYKVNRVALNWEAAFGKRYRIETSASGGSWTTAVTVTDGAAGRREHTFSAVEARHVRMYGVERGLEHGGFSLWDFEVYGEEANVEPPASEAAAFFIPKVNETGYWWQGENARLASMASAFIIGAPIADHTGVMWADTLFTMAAAQLDWILGRNPFSLCMMYGYGDVNYDHYTHATRYLENIKGGICNGISSARANENNIEFAPYKGEQGWGEEGDDLPWRNWRYIEQWLPHNAWYLVAVSSLAHRIDNPIEPEVISVRHGAAPKQARMRITASRGKHIRIELPFAAGARAEAAVYNMQGRKVFSHPIKEGSKTASIKVPAKTARGIYVLTVRDAEGKNRASDRIHLR